jgi:protein SCO1/2
VSPQKKIQLGIAVVLSVVTIVIAVAMITRPLTPPVITGVLIPEALPIKEFSLLDHNNREFSNTDLAGQWHFISYGYTYCPDICPTTLTTLAQVAKSIEKDQKFSDIEMLFYTVDPERDTTDRLAEYLPWFHPGFVGLTAGTTAETGGLAFEKSLGIMAVLTPLEMDEGLEDHGGYSVSHGVSIYLLNPDGKLQAVFKPQTDKDGTQFFTAKQIYGDYKKIRKYLG